VELLYQHYPEVPSALSTWQQQQQPSSEVRVLDCIIQFNPETGLLRAHLFSTTLLESSA
jgi:hypothetical protein